jgi:LysR family transcriptional regulator for bpeEF and oprC
MIEQLQSFVAVVDAGSFSSASRRLGVPKSTISQRVQQLEQHLGVLLLQRSTRAVRPTDTGRAYYERCIRIIAEIADAELVARGEQAAPSGVLRVCRSNSACTCSGPSWPNSPWRTRRCRWNWS